MDTWTPLDPPLYGVGVVNGMPRAGLHYNLGTARGPDKIGSLAGPGPRAVSCRLTSTNQLQIMLFIYYLLKPP